MPVGRLTRRFAALPIALVLVAAATAATVAHTVAVTKPGPTTRPVTLSVGSTLSGFDVASGPSGTAYVGWITSNAELHLCTVKLGTTSCAGGVQSIPIPNEILPAALRVLVQKSGTVDLVWSYGIPGGTSQIGLATATGAGKLSAPTVLAAAPESYELLDAEIGPDGAVWTVSGTTYTDGLQVADGKSVKRVNTPYSVGPAELAFAGTTPVIATQVAGYITKPAGYLFESHGSWSAVHNVPDTWTAGARVGLADTRSGLRLIASVPNADYWPVVSSWTGTSFSTPVQTGDRNDCSPSSHDAVVDASGRLADVSAECEQIAVANLPGTRQASVVRFAAGGTLNSGEPRLTTTPRGYALVVWSIEAGTFDRLLMVPVLLPGLTTTVTSHTSAGSVTVTGPVSCLPADDVAVGVKGRPASHWHVQAQSLKLGAKTLHSVLAGASLAAGQTYRLTGHVTFADGGARRSVTATLAFRACPSP